MSSYYIVDDGTDSPWIYDLYEGDFDKYGLDIPDWIADEIKGQAKDWRNGTGINPDEDKICIYEFNEDDIDKYNLHIINKFFNDYKFSEEIRDGADLKDWLIDRDVCPEQCGIYRSELLEFIKDHCTGTAFWLDKIPGIKIMDVDENSEDE
jgi:hypothetical protein